MKPPKYEPQVHIRNSSNSPDTNVSCYQPVKNAATLQKEEKEKPVEGSSLKKLYNK